ncbi:MAG: hypothetical protein ACLPID_06665 [Beijerinckiaceae bacterium]
MKKIILPIIIIIFSITIGQAKSEDIVLSCSSPDGSDKFDLEINESRVTLNGENQSNAEKISINDIYISFKVENYNIGMIQNNKIDRSTGILTLTVAKIGTTIVITRTASCTKVESSPRKF